MWKVDRLTKWEEAEGLGCYFTVGRNQFIIINTVYSAGTRSGPFISSHHEESCTERLRLNLDVVELILGLYLDVVELSLGLNV
ncbi:hypothetical protein AMELA_G00244160, partial [Ameiurus melas]